VARDAEGGLLAFGQYYPKLGRCHLARIAIAPTARGRGLGRSLVTTLMDDGRRHLGVDGCSLYVLADNRPAVACYRACGFEFAEDPEPQPAMPDCLFMVAEARSCSPA
jgi:ribosomal protein S18 acetylase RimI-like enzyme